MLFKVHKRFPKDLLKVFEKIFVILFSFSKVFGLNRIEESGFEYTKSLSQIQIKLF